VALIGWLLLACAGSNASPAGVGDGGHAGDTGQQTPDSMAGQSMVGPDSAGAGGAAGCACPPGEYYVTAIGTWSGQRELRLDEDLPVGYVDPSDRCDTPIVRGVFAECGVESSLTFGAQKYADSLTLQRGYVTYSDGEDAGVGKLDRWMLDVSVPGVISGTYAVVLNAPTEASGGEGPSAEQVPINGSFRLCAAAWCGSR
jgi:hypothetical protein